MSAHKRVRPPAAFEQPILPAKAKVGRCRTCGYSFAVVIREGSLTEAQGACPHCGVQPFYVDSIR